MMANCFFLKKVIYGLLFSVILWLSADDNKIVAWEQYENSIQPPDRIMDAVGVKEGMVIGEIGAGRGRYTVHLAKRVGNFGKILANDINQARLDELKLRCEKENIGNVQIILSKTDDPLFPANSLDMAFMILTYHHLEKPVALMKKLIPSLKPGATLVIIDPDPIKGKNRGKKEVLSPKKLKKQAKKAGFKIIRQEDFLIRDNIFILQVK